MENPLFAASIITHFLFFLLFFYIISYFFDIIIILLNRKEVFNTKNLKKYLNSEAALTGLIALTTYILLTFGQTFIFDLVGIDLTNFNLTLKIMLLIAYEILITSSIILLFSKSLEKAYLDLKKNHKKYFSKCFKYWIFGLISSTFVNMLIMTFFNSNISNNEQAIRDIFQISPIYIFISAVLLAPITEELVFRKSIRNIFKNDYIFLIVASLIFGALHVVTSAEALVDYLYIIPYSLLGLSLSYMLKKTNNILVPICFHTFHNGILISLQFLLLFFNI